MQSPNEPYPEQDRASPASIHSAEHSDPPPPPPGALHLTPCTLEQYCELGYDHEDRYELEEGVLVWKPLMVDDEHVRIVTWCNTLLMSHLPDDIRRAIAVLQNDVVGARMGKKDYEEETSGKPGPSSARNSPSDGSPPGSQPSCRYVDLKIVSLSDFSTSSDRILSPTTGRRIVSNPPALMAVENTSTKCRADLNERVRHCESDKETTKSLKSQQQQLAG